MDSQKVAELIKTLKRGLKSKNLKEVVEGVVTDLETLSVLPPISVVPPIELYRRALAQDRGPHFNFCVASSVATGKTTLVRAIAKAMADEDVITRIIVYTMNVITAKESFTVVCRNVFVYPFSETEIQKI